MILNSVNIGHNRKLPTFVEGQHCASCDGKLEECQYPVQLEHISPVPNGLLIVLALESGRFALRQTLTTASNAEKSIDNAVRNYVAEMNAAEKTVAKDPIIKKT